MSRADSRFAAALLVAVLACVIAAPGSAKPKTPKGGAKAASSDTSAVLIRVGHETITRADVQRRIEDLPEAMRSGAQSPEGRQQLLDRMVEEKVWMMSALQAGVADRDRVRAQLEDQRRNLIIRTWIQEVMATAPAPSDSESKIYYEQHLADYRVPANVTVRHIQTRTQADARKALASLKAGGDFTRVAKTASTDTLTRSNGGMLGAVTKEGQFAVLGHQPALAESVFTLKKGQVGGPWKTERGWHLIRADEVNPETTRPFEQVRPMILRQLSGDRARLFYNSKLDSLRRTLGVTPDSAAIKRFVSQRKTAREMFQEAQARTAAADRIMGYQELLSAYPESDVAPQAQFMIGFIQSEELKNYDEAEKAFRAVLTKYPKSELAASAQWMVQHMRSEDAPQFNPTEADSSRTPTGKTAVRNSSGKP
jgi:peptidyl-prolyl cis-trans isomerase C